MSQSQRFAFLVYLGHSEVSARAMTYGYKADSL